MMGRMFVKALRSLGILKPKSNARMSNSRQITMGEYREPNPLSDEQVADFLECLKRRTDIHPVLLADISPPVDILFAAEEGEATATVIGSFILVYLIENDLRIKGKSFDEIGQGQLRRAASEWAVENLADT